MKEVKKDETKFEEKNDDIEKEECVNIKVAGQDSNEIHFRIKMTMAMGKLKKSYSERFGAPITSLRFLFDGKRIKDEKTQRVLKWNKLV